MLSLGIEVVYRQQDLSSSNKGYRDRLGGYLDMTSTDYAQTLKLTMHEGQNSDIDEYGSREIVAHVGATGH